MSANVTHSYDVQVNHSVVFKCTTHEALLTGEPTFFYVEEQDEVHWKIDLSDMSCDMEEGEFGDTCSDSWKVTIDALEVA